MIAVYARESRTMSLYVQATNSAWLNTKGCITIRYASCVYSSFISFTIDFCTNGAFSVSEWLKVRMRPIKSFVLSMVAPTPPAVRVAVRYQCLGSCNLVGMKLDGQQSEDILGSSVAFLVVSQESRRSPFESSAA